VVLTPRRNAKGKAIGFLLISKDISNDIRLTEQLVFPEIDYDRIDSVRGMDITIVTTAKNDEQARFLLRELGMPFTK